MEDKFLYDLFQDPFEKFIPDPFPISAYAKSVENLDIDWDTLLPPPKNPNIGQIHNYIIIDCPTPEYASKAYKILKEALEGKTNEKM